MWTARAAVLRQAGAPMTIETIDVGPLAAGDVLVRIRAASLCHTDLDIIGAGSGTFALPLTLGHEISGTVAGLGDAVTDWAVGDAGLVYLAWACLECRQCRSGRENLCQQAGRVFPPTTPGIGLDGGMAEFVRIPARYLLPLGDLDPVLAAPLADAGLTPQGAARHKSSSDWLLPKGDSSDSADGGRE